MTVVNKSIIFIFYIDKNNFTISVLLLKLIYIFMILQLHQYVIDEVKLLVIPFIKAIIHQVVHDIGKSYRRKSLLFEGHQCDFGKGWMNLFNNNIHQLPNMSYAISYMRKYLLFQ